MERARSSLHVYGLNMVTKLVVSLWPCGCGCRGFLLVMYMLVMCQVRTLWSVAEVTKNVKIKTSQVAVPILLLNFNIKIKRFLKLL